MNHVKDKVFALRKQLWNNGFRPLAVTTPVMHWTGVYKVESSNRGKKPKPSEGWGELAMNNPPHAVTHEPESDALNTGIYCKGLVPIDIDIDDASIVPSIVEALQTHLGPAPKRYRPDSPRCLYLYRASEDVLNNPNIVGDGGTGKVEIRSQATQFVAFGKHQLGQDYLWDCSPETFTVEQLPVVSQAQIRAFSLAVATVLGVEPPKEPATATTALNGPVDITLVRDCHRRYAAGALKGKLADFAQLNKPNSNRNQILNDGLFDMGGYVANGSIEFDIVSEAYYRTALDNNYVSVHGEAETRKTIFRSLSEGMLKPHELRGTDELDGPIINVAAMIQNAEQASVQRTNATKPAKGKRTVTLMQGSDINERPIEWLWPGYLPRGKLTLLAGAGGTGKSTIAFNLAATITNGDTWPDGSRCKAPGNVLIWSSEDDPNDTIKPRLMAVGANPGRYRIVTGTVDENGERCPFDAASDMDLLRDAVRQIGGVSLFIIDPIVTAVTGDANKVNDVRRGLQSIVDFAADMNCAVVGITHFSKGTAGKNPAERVIGSQAFAALARMVLVAAKEEDSNNRVFTRAKTNIAPDGGGFSYSIETLHLHSGIETTRVVWGEGLQGSPRNLLDEIEGDSEESTSKRAMAKKYLMQALSNGPTPSKELFEDSKERFGISGDTLRRAQRDLGVEASKSAFNGGWLWSLPQGNLVGRLQ